MGTEIPRPRRLMPLRQPLIGMDAFAAMVLELHDLCVRYFIAAELSEAR